MYLYLVRYPALKSINDKCDSELVWGLKSICMAKNVSWRIKWEAISFRKTIAPEKMCGFFYMLLWVISNKWF